MINGARASANFSTLRTPRKRGKLRPSQGEGLDRRLYLLSVVMVGASVLLHQPLLLVAGILLFLVLVTTDIWARYCLQNVSYQRQLSEQRALFGEELIFSISIENAKLLPLSWLELEDTLSRTLSVKDMPARASLHSNLVTLECLFNLRWYERVTRHYTLQCNHRGVHTIGPTTLRSGDVFGFLKRETRVLEQTHLLVYPLVVPLSSFQLPARHPFGDYRASRRLLEDPSRTIGVRDYVYGDSLRRVDWKATARTLQLQSKIYEPTTTYTLNLFVDAAMKMDIHYGIHPELRELVLCAAASITDWAIDEGYAVGLFANTIMHMPEEETWNSAAQEPDLETTLAEQVKRRRIRLPVATSEEQRKRIMEALARIQSYFGTSIEEVLLNEHSHLAVGSTVVLITSAISETLVEALIHLRRTGHAVTVLFVSDYPAPHQLSGIPVYHLGGQETWQKLVAERSTKDETHSEVTGFHL